MFENVFAITYTASFKAVSSLKIKMLPSSNNTVTMVTKV